MGILFIFLFATIRVIWRDLSRASATLAGAGGMANLEIVDPARAALSVGERIALYGVTSIGREPDNDFVVDEDTVSGRHARVVPRNGRWWIEDLGSTNGTWVNNHQVDGARPLRPGDLIHVGRVGLRFAS